RQALLDAGGYLYRDHPVEDYELWCRMAVRGFRFANLPDRLLRYRLHSGAMKATKLRGVLRGTLDIKRRYWKGQLGLRGQARLWAEQALLWLPAPFVWHLFARLAYRPA
ncbi:MAG: hypothetical protein AB7K24_30515, partial [Gemmataceae bacterium]